MSPSQDTETGHVDKGIRQKLLIIEALVFALPFLALAYVLYGHDIQLELSHLIIFALILILILAGLVILRQVFDRFAMMTKAVKQAVGFDQRVGDIHRDTDGLHEITVSFNDLMERFEGTTEELGRRVYELFAIKELTEVASKTLDIDELLTILLEKALQVSRAGIGSVLFFEPDRHRFRIVACKGWDHGPGEEPYIDMDDTFAGFVVSQNEPLLVKDIETDPRTKKQNDPKYGPPSFLSMPIFVRDNPLAVVNLACKTSGDHFDSDDMDILSIMIGEIGFTLENAILHAESEKHLKELETRTDELSDINAKLQKEIIVRKKAQTELQHSKEVAENANVAKSDFLANMSHELRTPLNHIIGFTDLVLEKRFGELSDKQAEYLNDVLLSARHLLSLINDILDLSKVEAGKLEMKLDDVSIRSLLENSLIMVKEKALKHGIDLSVDINGTPDQLIADERMFKQIMYNLLSNAIKFTPDGGKVHLTASRVKSADLGFSDAPQNPEEWVQVSVEDSGVGIDKEDLTLVFEPFEQLQSPINNKIKGTGLGLSLTKKLVEMHGGRVWAKSEGKGKGSTFHFVLPMDNGS